QDVGCTLDVGDFPTCYFFFFFQAEDGIRDFHVTGVQTCALPIFAPDIVQDPVGTAPPAEPACLGVEEGLPEHRLEPLRPGRIVRSEERRVGREGRSRWGTSQSKKNK